MQYKLSYSSGKDKTHKKPKGSPREVRRDFIPQYADEKRTKNNIIIKSGTIAEAYENVFGDAQRKYNDKQKRKSRKMNETYFEHLFGVKPDTVDAEKEIKTNKNKQQSFYEYVVGIGDMYNAGLQDTVSSFKDNEGVEHSFEVKANPEAAAKMTEILKEYAEQFQKRNPNLYVMQAIIHLDESTPHLHLQLVPWSEGYKTGLYRQQGINEAFKAIGIKGTNDKLADNWRKQEREVVKQIAMEHGVEIAPEEKGRGETLTREEMQEYKAIIHAKEIVQKELEEIKTQITNKQRLLTSVTNAYDEMNGKRSTALREYTKAKSDRDAAEKQYAEYCERLQVYDDNIEAYKRAKKQEADEEIKEYKEQQQKECDNQIQTAYNQQMQQIERKVRETLNAAAEITDFYGDLIKTDSKFKGFSDDKAILQSEMDKINAAKSKFAYKLPKQSSQQQTQTQYDRGFGD